jgi:hypothetical protein
MRSAVIISVTFFVVFVGDFSFAAETSEGVFEPAGVNLALGKSYTFNRPPNYVHCTDPADATQLTDGEYSEGYFWVQKTTVGWQRVTPVLITIDLGKIEPIAGVSYSTAAGFAGVSWPTSIGILVSDDGETWTQGGDLVRLGTEQGTPAADSYSQFRFVTGKLRTRGRYVQLAIDGSPYVFADEIEVYRGPDELLDKEPEGKKIMDVEEYLRDARIFSAIVWRLRTDLEAVREAIRGADLEGNYQNKLMARADDLAKEIEGLPQEVPGDFRTVLPFSDLHARIYALNAPILRSRGLLSFNVWCGNRWDPLGPMEVPDIDETVGKPSLEIHAMRNEVRATAFNTTNAMDLPLKVLVNINGLPGGPNPGFVTVHEVPFTDTRDRFPIAAALPEASKGPGGYEITVPAGCNRQVWLSFDTRDIQPGTYTGGVEVSWLDDAQVTFPLKLMVYPFEMPEEFTIAVGGWDYTDGGGRYDAKPSNIPVLIRTLREYGVNTPWATSGVMPKGGEYDEKGKLVSELDFGEWDEWIERWPDAKHYCVFLSVGRSFDGEEMGSPRFNRMVGDWMKAWVEHIRDQGIDRRKFAVLLADEPSRDEQVERIVLWAEAIEAAAPEVVIWEDVVYRDPTEAPARLFEVCDVLSPNLPMFMGFNPEGRQVYVNQTKAGKTLWFYSCSGPGKQLDPYNYHRGQFWWSLKYGSVGSCYWAFGDEGGSGNSWNAYLQTRNQYSPLFLDATSVTRGKHMEAIREGAQDYEYFVMLRKRIEELEKRGVSNPVLEKAKGVLNEGPERVVAQLEGAPITWGKEFDRSLMDQVRVEVLEALVELEDM